MPSRDPSAIWLRGSPVRLNLDSIAVDMILSAPGRRLLNSPMRLQGAERKRDLLVSPIRLARGQTSPQYRCPQKDFPTSIGHTHVAKKGL